MTDNASEAAESLGTSRIEAFSDAVMAVIITIMALEIRAPAGAGLDSLGRRVPELLAYLLSFAFIAIYWNNHHHLLRATSRISSGVMWANMVLLFCLSLIPAATEWAAGKYSHALPAAIYGIVSLAAAFSYSLLVRMIVRADERNAPVAVALGSDLKGTASLVIYASGIGLAFVSWPASYCLYAVVSTMWFIPDRRLTRRAWA